MYHTHPSSDVPTEFTKDDIETADEHSVPSYIITPAGEIEKYNPSTGCYKAIPRSTPRMCK